MTSGTSRSGRAYARAEGRRYERGERHGHVGMTQCPGRRLVWVLAAPLWGRATTSIAHRHHGPPSLYMYMCIACKHESR